MGNPGLDEPVMSMVRQIDPVEVRFTRDGIALLESHHEEGFFMDWRRDPFDKILIVIAGEGILFREEKQFAIQASSLLVIPRKLAHRIADLPGRPLSLVGVCLKRAVFREPQLLSAAFTDWRIETGTILAERTENWIREVLVEERIQRPAAGVLQKSLVLQMLVELARQPNQISTGYVASSLRVEAYVQALEREFWKPTCLDMAAKSVGLSRRRFTQLFKAVTGESWLARVNRLRMEHATALLQSTRLSVRSIAFECGYADLTHFYRTFKARYRTSPGQWRDAYASVLPPTRDV